MKHWQNTFFVFPKKSLNPSIALSHSLSTYLSITQNMFTYANPTKKKPTNTFTHNQIDSAHTQYCCSRTHCSTSIRLSVCSVLVYYISLSPSLSLSLSLSRTFYIYHITLFDPITNPHPSPFPLQKKVLFKQVLTHLCPHLVRLATHK